MRAYKFNITSHQGNKTTMRYHSVPVKMVIIKRQKIINISKDVGKKRKSLHTVGVNVNKYNNYGDQCEGPTKIKRTKQKAYDQPIHQSTTE
jgi:hypothetical protein